VRWYEFRLDGERTARLHQQGTYAPDGFYRWMASPGMDRKGNIGIGYSFGGTPNYAGQRFAGRLADDPLGQLTLHETVLVHGEAAQTNTLRWEDYTQTSMDPSDDCTFWYVGDYLKAGAPSYTTRIGAFRMPGCLSGTVSGTTFYDLDHDGMRQPTEPGIPGWPVEYSGARRPQDQARVSSTIQTDEHGDFQVSLPADPAYSQPVYTFSSPGSTHAAWSRSGRGVAHASGGALPMADGEYTVWLTDREDVVHVSFGNACVVPVTGGRMAEHWSGGEGRSVLAADDQPLPEEGAGGRRGRGAAGRGRGGRGGGGGWRAVVNLSVHLVTSDGGRFQVSGTGDFDQAYGQLTAWLRDADGPNVAHRVSAKLATAALNLAYAEQDGSATLHDPVEGDWPTIGALIARVSDQVAAGPDATEDSAAGSVLLLYEELLEALNANLAPVTPSSPERCPSPF
jgi:hypothetical protein